MGILSFLFGDEKAPDKTTKEASSSTASRLIDPEMRKIFTGVAGTGQKLVNQPYEAYKPTKSAKKTTSASGRVAKFSDEQKQTMQDVMGLEKPEEFGKALDLYNKATGYTPETYAAQNYTPDTFKTDYQLERYQTPEAMRAYGESQYVPGTFSQGYTARDYQAPTAVDQFGEASQLEAPQQFGYYGGLSGVGQPDVFGAERAQQYMSPYMQAVTDVAARKAREEAARQSAIGGLRAAQYGGLGASGQAIYNANLGRSLIQDIGDLYTKGQQSAYENAQQQYERDRAAAMQGYQLNQSTQAQNFAQRLANYQANEAARQTAYGLNLQGQGQTEAQRLAAYQALEAARQIQGSQGLAGFQAGQEAQQAAERARQAAYGLDLSAQGQNAAQGLAAFQTNEAARQFAANNLLNVYQANQAAQQYAAKLNADQALQAFQANESAKQAAAANELAAASGIASLGTAEQAADLKRLGAQMDVGAAKTGRRQAVADVNYANYLEKRDFPTSQYTKVAPIVLNTPYNTTVTGSSRGTTNVNERDNSGFLPNVIGTAMKYYTLNSGGSGGSFGSGWG